MAINTSSGMLRVLTAVLGGLCVFCAQTFLPVAGAAYAQVAVNQDFADRNQRIFVLTDIGNEPDDQMSLVRLLIYSNEIDIEGLAAVTSTWLRKDVQPETIRELLSAYGEVRPNLEKHAGGWPSAQMLQSVVTSGPDGYGLAAIKADAPSSAAQALIAAADKNDPRPLWVSIWGGANVLAEALQQVRASRSPERLDAFVAKLRVYSISDQDDAGPWIRKEFPKLFYIVSPSNPDSESYASATWTGVSGDGYYLNGEGADGATITNAWLDTHIRKGVFGRYYPKFEFIMEGDTPAFLGLTRNGLNSAQSPAWGGWGGRYVLRKPYGESRAIWTQGGAMMYGADSRDQVWGLDGRLYRSDQATIWRWRSAFQDDFAARMDWTVQPYEKSNHRPIAIVNGDESGGPIYINATVGQPVILDASRSADPDKGQKLTYRWFHYAEAGVGLGPLAAVTIKNPSSAKATMIANDVCRPIIPGKSIPCRSGVAHVILEVKDNGAPTLTSYRRVIVKVSAAASN